MDLRQRVELIYQGRFEAAGVRALRWSLDELETLATGTRLVASRPDWHCSPRGMAYALGRRCVPRAPPGTCGEGTARGVIGYAWDPDWRIRGLRIAHGLCHDILKATREPHDDGEAWLMTGGILIPQHVALNRPYVEIVALAHAPEWFISLRVGLVKFVRDGRVRPAQ